jgi:hypothetical protein
LKEKEIMRPSFKKFIVSVLACVFVVPAFAQAPGPQDAERSVNREQVWRIPAAGGSPLMRTLR